MAFDFGNRFSSWEITGADTPPPPPNRMCDSPDPDGARDKTCDKHVAPKFPFTG